MAVTEVYERSKEWKGFKKSILKRRAELYTCERRGIKFREDLRTFDNLEKQKDQSPGGEWRRSSSKGGEIVGNHSPQLGETSSNQVSSEKTEEIAEWMDRVLKERTDWPWD